MWHVQPNNLLLYIAGHGPLQNGYVDGSLRDTMWHVQPNNRLLYIAGHETSLNVHADGSLRDTTWHVQPYNTLLHVQVKVYYKMFTPMDRWRIKCDMFSDIIPCFTCRSRCIIKSSRRWVASFLHVAGHGTLQNVYTDGTLKDSMWQVHQNNNVLHVQIMCGLTLATKGLTEIEIRDMLSIPSAAWSPVYFAIKDFILDHSGLLR